MTHHAVSRTLGISDQCEKCYRVFSFSTRSWNGSSTPVECEIPSLKIDIHALPDTTELEERLLHLENMDERCRDALTANEAHKNRVKNQYDKAVNPRIFSKGELVFLWDQDKEPLGAGKFKSTWLGPYVVSKVLKKEVYKLTDFDGNKLSRPRNVLYLKNYYA